MRTKFYHRSGQLPAWLLLGASGLLASPALAQTPATFAPVATTGTGAGSAPISLAVADVSGDGKLDLLSVDQQNKNVNVQLGTGSGSFGPVTAFSTGAGIPWGIVVADVDRDGAPDLLTVSTGTNTVGVRRGTGTGSFSIYLTEFSTGADSAPIGLAVADVDGDGNLDVVTANSNGDSAGLLLGTGSTGSNSFRTVRPYSTGAGGHPYQITVADVNGDGRPDLLAANANTNSIGVLLNLGFNTFSAATSFSTGAGSAPTDIVVADVNGDGQPDLLTANNFGAAVGVLLGTGTGTFGPVVPYGTGTGSAPFKLAVADVNGDGRPDLLADNRGSDAAGVLLGNGDGTFGPVTQLSVGAGSHPQDIVAADVNADGKLDLLTADFNTSAVGVLLNTTNTAAFSTRYTYTGGTQTYTVPAGVTRLAIVAVGGQGGGYEQRATTYPYGLVLGPSAPGAKVQATVAVTPGEVLTVVVGGTGESGSSFAPRPNNYHLGGYNGGGRGALSSDASGGGGATDVRRQGTRTSDYLASRNALVVAGGSGGNARAVVGGYPGIPNAPGVGAASGATQTGPGVGSASPVNDGRSSVGGDGIGTGGPSDGAGGGGGYYGGGGSGDPVYGNNTAAGGGGGSSFAAAGSTDVTYTIDRNLASSVTLTPVAVTYPDLVVATTTSIAAGTYNSITVNSPGVATLGGNVTVTSSVTVNTGATLNDGCAVISGAGTFTLAAGGTLGICNAAGISSSGATGAVQTTGARSFSTDASYVYNGTASQRTGTGLPAQVRNLSTANDSTVVLSAATRVAELLTLDAAGNLVLNGQALTLLSSEDGTALVVNRGTGIVQGAATVQRYLDPGKNPGLGYRHYAAPVSGSTVADLATTGFAPVLTQSYNTSATPGATTPFPTVFGYDQGRLATVSSNYPAFDKGFFVPASLSTPLEVGRGYAVNINGTQLVDFTGTLTTGNQTLTLARNAGATAADAGWALVGNPYPAPIDFRSLTDGGLVGLDASMYVFESSGQYVGQYRAYVNGLGGNPLVGSSQGFFVRVSSGQTSGTIAFRNAQRLTSFANQVAVYRTAADPRPLVQLELRGASGPADVLYAYAEAGATPATDAAYDAVKLPNPTGLNLASLAASGESLAIDGRPAFTAATVIALTVGVPAAGTYALRAPALANLPAGLAAYLRDAQTGQLTRLSAGTSYTFSASTAEAQATIVGRFSLQFGAASPLATTPALLAAEVSVYPNPAHESFVVVVPAVAGASQVQAQLCNALGQVVRTQTAALPATGARLSVPTGALAAGVYVLRLQAGSSTTAQRVVIQ
ncbi:FG-GAP-like repeat-containing protein [Hymenobacter cheonanensis]|uniref:FG-GAP-like repeat-containing protein n=1 Tax=Hymenobacter sp. CA2-7 TaxID=3063993 RepID=UPI00271294D9|nr:FG-GAP-like repeat-containing protein [Hymenobacter sp. CA2-7]MDO7884907.1 FG-GAP-like repeat-containing protein [Hymenobacter sp. CA2-7]